MIDFLRANPYVTREEYLWEWTVPQIKLAMYDYTRVEYNDIDDDKPKKKVVTRIDSAEDLLNDLGCKMFKTK